MLNNKSLFFLIYYLQIYIEELKDVDKGKPRFRVKYGSVCNCMI